MKTIRVRIAVAVSPNGCWSCNGNKLMPDWHHEEFDDRRNVEGASAYVFKEHGAGRVVFVEADVPVPDAEVPLTIEGSVAT